MFFLWGRIRERKRVHPLQSCFIKPSVWNVNSKTGRQALELSQGFNQQCVELCRKSILAEYECSINFSISVSYRKLFIVSSVGNSVIFQIISMDYILIKRLSLDILSKGYIQWLTCRTIEVLLLGNWTCRRDDGIYTQEGSFQAH